MSSNSILAEIAARELGQINTGALMLYDARTAERVRKKEYFDECAAELSQAVQQLVQKLEHTKNNLPLQYGEGTVVFTRRHCNAIAETFYEQVENKRHLFYRYMQRSEQRRRESLRVRSKAIEVVGYLDKTILKHQLYERAKVEAKIFELIIALRNLDPLPA